MVGVGNQREENEERSFFQTGEWLVVFSREKPGLRERERDNSARKFPTSELSYD